MKAIQISKNGGPEVLELKDISLEKPTAEEVTIEHKAIGLNYIDTYHRSGLYPLKLPTGIGAEGAGIITEVGSNVKDFKTGDRVSYAGAPLGSYSTHRNYPTKNLVKVPDMRDFKDFDISCKKLKKVFCDTWGGWVYISLSDNDPGDLIDFLNPVAKELECFNSSDLITVYKKNVTVKANWKTCLDAFMEVYDAPTIHKDTVNILLDGNAMAAGLLKNGHSRMVTPKKMNLDGGFLGAEESDYVPYIETCDKIHAQTNVAYGMFPNFITPTDTSGYPAILFWPKGLRETEFEWTQLAPKWPGDEKPDYWNEQETSFDSIMDEDFKNLEPMQRSHDAGVFESMPLNYQERRIYYYHQVIDDWIGRDNLPENIQVPNVLDPFIEG